MIYVKLYLHSLVDKLKSFIVLLISVSEDKSMNF